MQMPREKTGNPAAMMPCCPAPLRRSPGRQPALLGGVGQHVPPGSGLDEPADIDHENIAFAGPRSAAWMNQLSRRSSRTVTARPATVIRGFQRLDGGVERAGLAWAS
jgi:hypothetical protein